MLIKVMYQNGEIATVEAYQLDELIAHNKVKKFLHSDGWSTVGVDPIRNNKKG
jgi:hypothetical protein